MSNDKQIMRFHTHIDNGGVTVSIIRKAEFNIDLEIDASYFGYPAIKSTIDIGHLQHRWLEKLGIELIKASKVLSELENKNETTSQ